MFACEISQIKGKNQYSIEGELTIANAGAFRQAINRAIDDKNLGTIELSQTSSVDLAGLQLICALVHILDQVHGDRPILTGVPQVLLETAGAAGFPGICPKDFEKQNCIWKEGAF